MTLSNRGQSTRRASRPQLVALEDRLTPSTGVMTTDDHLLSPNGSATPDGMAPDQERGGYDIGAIPAFGGTTTADGAGQTIAIVDAFDDPTIASDLAAFDSFYGTATNEINAQPVSSFFTEVNQRGGTQLPPPPPPGDDWTGEISLDVEWAHVIAPMANIILVECDSEGGLNDGAAWAQAHPGVSVVSDSWGGDEYPSESSDDSGLITPASHAGVTMVFSSGDNGIVEYPAASPDVLAVGATNLTVGSDNSWKSETGWTYDLPSNSGGGGGLSEFETAPSFQTGNADVAGVVGTARGTPDVAMNGGPDSALSIYDSTADGSSTPWDAEYGTSASAPQWAGLLAIVNQGRAIAGLGPLDGQTQTLPDLYSLPTSDFHDITVGSNASGNSAGPGYDLLTGLGSPIAPLLVPDLVAAAPVPRESTMSLTATPAAPGVFDAVAVTATVTGTSLVPTGGVDFTVGSTDLGTVTLVNGVATLHLAPMPAGMYTVTASYAGDVNDKASTATLKVVVKAEPSTTTLTAASTALVYGGSDTFSAAVAGLTGHPPTGAVDFKDGSTDLGTVALVNDVATLPATALPVGTDVITATYLGDTNYGTSTVTVTVTVQKAFAIVTALNTSVDYGVAVSALPFSVTGLVNGDTLATAFTGALATTATPASPTGAYPITQGTLAAADYNFSFARGILSVVKAPLTLTANSVQVTAGSGVPVFTYSLTGLVNGDTPAVVIGGVTFSTPATATSPAGTYPVTPVGGLATNYVVTDVPGTVTVVAPPPVVPPPPPVVPVVPVAPPPPLAPAALLVGSPQYAVGTDAGGAAVELFAANGSTLSEVDPFPASFTGGIRVASADFAAGGPPDVIAGSGPGISNEVFVLNGTTGKTIASFNPFETSFTGGVYVAVGDVNGDGVPDVIVTPDQSGGPVVAVYDGAALAQGQVVQVARFFGINDPNFRGGDRAAVGDLTGNGVGDLIVSAGFGGGPRVAIYNGTTIASGNPTELMPDFFAFEPSLRNGVYVTAGDVTGDGHADLIFGAGPGGAPRVRIADPAVLMTVIGQFSSLDDPAAGSAGIASFFAGDPDSRGGVRVTAKDLEGNAQADLVTGDGEGSGGSVTTYTGAAIVANTTNPASALTYDVFPFFNGGVFVG
ncbi:Ig-like domain repeat protein [Fimbriiglobus ruber]|uniref:Flagellar hook-length control protein FliK n=1 Tax=Fimbriiglobus ruber TaxID=1908690 RepID=A0A225D6M4_9BACT|nr:Ig-like domain repeat protein [Fimbriiglobus ruber]OWK36633.1 Flagellar hook-length control protein FliK [Fimbriiglobus ruber]